MDYYDPEADAALAAILTKEEQEIEEDYQFALRQRENLGLEPELNDYVSPVQPAAGVSNKNNLMGSQGQRLPAYIPGVNYNHSNTVKKARNVQIMEEEVENHDGWEGPKNFEKSERMEIEMQMGATEEGMDAALALALKLSMEEYNSERNGSLKINPLAPALPLDECSICSDAGNQPLIKPACGHSVHFGCFTKWMNSKIGPGKLFTRLAVSCAHCRNWVEHQTFDPYVRPVQKMYDTVVAMARQRRIAQNERFDPNSDGDTIIGNFQYYQCFTCSTPYYGGSAECGVGGNQDEAAQERERICPTCKNLQGQMPTNCAQHGTEFISYKCRFCCEIANYFCSGTHHFCDNCHKFGYNAVIKPCPGPPTCTIKHPPNGTEFCLGCAKCVNERL